jgi:hypothetical protein
MNKLPKLFEMSKAELAKSTLALASMALNGIYLGRLYKEYRDKKEKNDE